MLSFVGYVSRSPYSISMASEKVIGGILVSVMAARNGCSSRVYLEYCVWSPRQKAMSGCVESSHLEEILVGEPVEPEL